MKRQRCHSIGIVLCILLGITSISRANEMQRLIFDAGVNIGLGATMVELTDSPAGDPTLAGYFSNAYNAILMIQERLQPPFQNIDLRPVLNQIARYPEYTATWNSRQRAAYLAGIYQVLRQKLSVIFDSRRGGIIAQHNCDAAFLDVGYHMGRANMAAFLGNESMRSSAISSVHNAIRTGMESSRNLICSFNIGAWGSLPISNARSSADLQGVIDEIRGIAQVASLAGDSDYGTPSFPDTRSGPDPDPGPAGQLTGSWRMQTGAIVRFQLSGNTFIGTMHNLSSDVISIGYQEGMEYFRFANSGNNVFTGSIIRGDKWSGFTWKPCRVTLSGETLTFSDLFDGGQASYSATRAQ